MATPTLSRIIPARKSAVGVVEKWRMPEWSNQPDRVVSLVADNKSAPADNNPRNTRGEDSNAGVQSEAEPAGFSDGYKQGMKSAELQMQQQLDQLSSMVNTLAAPVRCVSEEVAKEMLDLAIDIARSILKNELQLNPDLLVTFVKEAVERLPDSPERTQIAVNPQDLQLLNELNEQAETASNTNAALLDIEWMEDAGLARGKFIVSSGTSRIHGGIDEMLTRVCAGSLK